MLKKQIKEIGLADRLTIKVNLNGNGTPDLDSLELLPPTELTQDEKALILSDSNALVIRKILYEKSTHDCIALIGQQDGKAKRITVYQKRYGTENY